MGGKNKKIVKSKLLPFVSICTPTFNRRPFIPFMIKCFEHQTYPKDRIEWIIIDDGTDPIGDLVKDIPQVKYFYCEERMYLGKKRNYMHEMCTFKNDNDILIYFDDDENKCVLEISNNGFPLAEDFDFVRLVTWGEKTSDSAGKGIGGADILKIMENHNGSFELVNNPMEEFPVTYKLSFNIYADFL